MPRKGFVRKTTEKQMILKKKKKKKFKLSYLTNFIYIDFMGTDILLGFLEYFMDNKSESYFLNAIIYFIKVINPHTTAFFEQ